VAEYYVTIERREPNPAYKPPKGNAAIMQQTYGDGGIPQFLDPGKPVPVLTGLVQGAMIWADNH
jgi:hypothetical protein